MWSLYWSSGETANWIGLRSINPQTETEDMGINNIAQSKFVKDVKIEIRPTKSE